MPVFFYLGEPLIDCKGRVFYRITNLYNAAVSANWRYRNGNEIDVQNYQEQDGQDCLRVYGDGQIQFLPRAQFEIDAAAEPVE